MAGLLIPVLDPVAAELRRWSAEPFHPVRDNCGQSVVAYAARALGLPVPAAAARLGLFGTWRLVRDRNRFLAFCAARMAELGCSATASPQRGDVGVVDMAATGPTAAIWTGKLWAARGDQATVFEAAPVIEAWEVVCPKR